MTKFISIFALAFALGSVGACGSTDNEQVTSATCLKPTDPGCRIDVNGPSFVRWTASVTDGVANGSSTAVVKYAPGRFCMSGTVDSGPSGTGWGAILIVGLAEVDHASGLVVTPFDATARGIAQVRFNVDRPPLSGVLPQFDQLPAAECRQLPGCSLSLSEAAAVFESGPVTAQLGDFSRPDAAHPNAALDPTLLTMMQFYVAPLPGLPLDYEFCIRDLAFLDAGGGVITP